VSDAGSAGPVEHAAVDQPTVRVLGGNPTEVELAAAHAVISAVLAEQASHGAELLEAPVHQWSSRRHALRTPLTPSPGAWNAFRGTRGC